MDKVQVIEDHQKHKPQEGQSYLAPQHTVFQGN